MTNSLVPNHKIKTFTLPDGKEITIETGKLAKQADGSVVVKIGNTMLLATMCYTKEAKEGVDFLPLTVDYQEKYAALGRFPGGFFKREARPSEYEILISRLIDRAIRPLFPDDFHAEVQILVTLISGEMETMPDAYAALAASSAIAVSNIPFNGPISEVRVVKVDGVLKVNPTTTEIAKASLDLIVAGSSKDIVMVEGEAKEVSEEEMLEALALAHEYIKIQCKAQVELSELVGSTKKAEYSHEKNDADLRQKLFDLLYDKVYAVAKLANPNKHERSDAFKAIIKEYLESLPEDSTEDKGLIKKYYHDIEKEAARNLVLDDRIRLDGRKLNEVRPIWSEINYLPSAHGSSLFTRGETQSLTSVTLGTKIDEQMLDGAMISGTSKFLLHYNFPAFSTGEVKPNRGLGRREVGHGNLAMRSLKKVMPGGDTDYPYTVRVVSDILESNGSSSMATVCAGSLALMDAGVPISGGVSGIAMGLITNTKTGKYAVLSDILGDEDHLGDMDFKVAGTAKGITACQMDIKVDGLSYEVLKEALYQAKEGRAHILNEMNKTISVPVGDMKPHAPRSESFKVDKEFIGAIIGPGGKIIQEMQRTTGATIQIEEIDGKGVVSVFSSNKESLDAAVRKIKGIVTVPEVGEVYDGVVKSVQPYGAFVEFLPGKDGLLHISEIKWERVENMEGVLEIGEALKVKLVEVDPKTGKFRLSRKALLPKPEGVAAGKE